MARPNRAAAAATSALAALALAALGVAGTDAASWIEAGPERVSVIELYSSEGCSSCPPAEAWLARLRDLPGLWTRLVPLNFHVDYWDGLGWPDRFARKSYTGRQDRYVELLGLGSAYTPGFILDGQEWRRGWLARPPELPSPAQVGALRLRAEHDGLRVEFRPSEPIEGTLLLRAAILGFGLANEIAAGENRGRTLAQNFVVLGLEGGTAASRDGVFSALLPLPVVRADWPARGAIAAWVEREGDPTPLQALGADLDRLGNVTGDGA